MASIRMHAGALSLGGRGAIPQVPPGSADAVRVGEFGGLYGQERV